jgi:phosphotransferase system IIB component
MLLHILKNEHRLRVSENKVLKIIFGPKKEEINKRIVEKLHNEEFDNLYFSLNIVRLNQEE